jgi:lipopolysaccharide assembly outer membrane protein LptD (OstA)
MTHVGFRQQDGVGRIFMRTSAPVRFSVGEDGRRNVVVTLENTEIGLPNNERMLDASFFDTAVSLVKPETDRRHPRARHHQPEARGRLPHLADRQRADRRVRAPRLIQRACASRRAESDPMLCLLVTSLLYAGPGFAELPEIDVDTSRVTLHGERTLRDGRRKLTTLEGSATMLGDGVAVDADRIVYDETNRSATASGHVVARLASEGLMVVVGDVVTLKFEGDEVREVYLLDGRALAKKDTTAAALLAANTAEAAEKIGTTMGLLQGNHLTHDGGRWSAEQISLVPCECDFNKPSWNITAASATMDTKAERIALVSPVVRVFHVPVLWLPWLSLPMNSRQTGLLFPRPNWSPLNGYSLEAPVFVTLGRSADLTLTPGLFTGGTGTFGVAGPRLLAELRYVPSRRATGKVNLGLLWDLRDVRDPITKVGWRVPQAVGRAPRGLRGELAWSHAQDLERGFGTRVEFNAYSDGFYNRDINTDVVGSTNGLLRSTALLFHRGDQHVLTLDLTLRQDLNFGYDWLGQRPLVEGWTSPRFGPGRVAAAARADADGARRGAWWASVAGLHRRVRAALAAVLEHRR